MDKELQQQKEEPRKNKIAFDEIREKFKSWRFNMYLCLLFYVIFFVIVQAFNRLVIEDNVGEWLSKNEYLVVVVAATILGACFIADSIVTSYLKTPLQRLALKIDISPMEDKEKSEMMRLTQETNELFKETLKKFGILVIPAIIASVINTPRKMKVVDASGKEIGKLVEAEPAHTRNEWTLFYICYLIPIIFATWRIIQFNKKLRKIEWRILNEQKKRHNS